MSRNSLMAFLVVALFMGSALVLWEPGEGQFVDKFNGKPGLESDLVVLKGSGQTLYDPHLFVEVEKNVPISEASMKVSTVNSKTGPWIKNPSIDAGIDGNPEWKYSGTGYGDFGHSYAYSDDTLVKTNTYSGNQNKVLGNLMVPEGAQVHDADMTIRGRFEANIPSMMTLGSGGAIEYTPQYIRLGDVTGDKVNDTVMSSGKPGYLYLYKQVTARNFQKSRLTAISSSVYDYLVYDVDADGDNDIVYSTSNGVYWSWNDGFGNFGTSFALTTLISPMFMELGDMDGDGRKEIILGLQSFVWSSNQTTLFMLKRTTGTNYNLWPLFNTGSGSGTASLYFMKIGDWNNDNYMDIYLAFSNNRVYTYENPGNYWYYQDTSNISTKTRWSEKHIVTESYSIQGFDVGDIDKDGAADVVTTPNYYNANIKYWNNKGSSSWTSYNVVPGYIYYPQSLSLADLNDDGYLDIFFSTGTYYYYNRVSWLDSKQNPNKNSWSENKLLEGQNDYGVHCFTGDVDSDGYDDVGLFFTPNRQAIVWYNSYPHDGSNIGAGFIEDGGLVGFSDLEPCDVDQDGDVDMLMTAYNSGTVGWYENDGSPFNGQWNFYRINGVVVGGAKEVAWGDIDGDDDFDIAVSGYDSGLIVWFENTGDPKSIWKYHYIDKMTYVLGIGVGDFDEDGIMEIVASPGYYYGYPIYVYHTDDVNGTWSKHSISGGSISYCGAINITDMNKDGHLDIIVPVNGYSGTANIYRNPFPLNPFNRPWTVISAISGLQYPYEAIPFDINNDGVLDMIATQNYGGVKWGQAPANANSTSGWKSYDMYTSVSYPYGVDVSDLDNDGKADVFITSRYWWNYYVNDRGLYWYEEPDDNTKTWQARTLDSNTRSNYGVAVADLDDDGVTEIFSASFFDNVFLVSRPTLHYPSNLAIDLGNDGISDWTWGTTLRGTTIAEFSDELQYVIDTKPPGVTTSTDEFGNKMLSIPIYLRTQTGGRLTGADLDVTYNITFDVDNQGQFMRELSRIIPQHSDTNDPTLRIYFLFSGRSTGMALISDIQVEYNAPPKQKMALPTKFTVNEDSLKRGVLDLSQYFTDDYDPPQMLNYRARMIGSNSEMVKAYIENGANLTIDSTITKDYNGETYVQFVIKDNGGPGGTPPREMITNQIKIDVLPVDDPPVLGNNTLPSKLFGKEGEEVMVADLNGLNLFSDPDDPMGLSIRYYPVLDFQKTYPHDLSAVSIRISEKKLYIKSIGDWYGLNIPIRIYGYDKPDVNLYGDPYHTTTVDIENINDPPTFDPIPSITVKEDIPQNNVLDMSPYANDIDTPPLDLKFKLIGQTNRTFYKVEQDPNDQSKIHVRPIAENWHGIVDVVVEVSDGEYTAISEFRIFVGSVNDAPWIIIKDPIENRQVASGEFSIVGEAGDIEGIDRVEVWFQDKWYEALGKNSWGLTVIAPDFGSITEKVPLYAKVIDTDGKTAFAYVNITILPREVPPPPDRDNDGWLNWVDAFPDDPSEWIDSDGDKVGDNSDAFPIDPEWSRDYDKDGIPDEADEWPKDPENKDPPVIITRDPEDDMDLTLPIMLFVIAGLLLLLAIISVILFINKRNASLDPRKTVTYHAKMVKRRELFRKISGRDKIEKALERMQMRDVKINRPSLPYSPGPSPMPMRSGPALPMPRQQGQPVPYQQLPPAPGNRRMPPPTRRMPPPPIPGAKPPMR
ncbi:MAG: VCBS repeat-containing protein [Candidatus Thermoplasmatota archaeon]|nr:VCBS repeat-containing protein [Candidatus Thermoplasmatota archaeon]